MGRGWSEGEVGAIFFMQKEEGNGQAELGCLTEVSDEKEPQATWFWALSASLVERHSCFGGAG